MYRLACGGNPQVRGYPAFLVWGQDYLLCALICLTKYRINGS